MSARWSISHVFAFLTLVALLACVHTADGGVDCRKFVFAPICRGVAAKRSLDPARYPHENNRDPPTTQIIWNLNIIFNCLSLAEGSILGWTNVSTGNVPDLEDILAFFATSPTVQRTPVREAISEVKRKGFETMIPQDDEDMKSADVVYDWYMNARKRNKDMAVYDY